MEIHLSELLSVTICKQEKSLLLFLLHKLLYMDAELLKNFITISPYLEVCL